MGSVDNLVYRKGLSDDLWGLSDVAETEPRRSGAVNDEVA